MVKDNFQELTDKFLMVSLLGRKYKLEEGISLKELIDILLKVHLFGQEYTPHIHEELKIKLAIKRAYRDFCRTINKDEQLLKNKYTLKTAYDEAAKFISSEIPVIPLNQKDYDTWFNNCCEIIIKIGYTFGQAQKWVNMTMKYLIVLGYEPIFKATPYLHAPIDNDIVHCVVEKEHWNEYLPWSTDVLTKEKYEDLRKMIKAHADKEKTSVIKWEFGAWNKAPLKDN